MKYNFGQFKIVTLRESHPDFECVNPEHAAAYWRDHIATMDIYDPDKEHLAVLLLNTRLRVIGHHIVTIGTLDTCLCHPREVMRPVIVGNACAFIIMHNHPSGYTSPSESDIRMTREIVKAGDIMRIEMIDHVIVSREFRDSIPVHCSLKELGFTYKHDNAQ